MKCSEFETYIIDYIDQELEPSIIAEFEKHSASCEKCTSELQNYGEVLRLMAQGKMEEPHSSLRVNFYKNLPSGKEKKVKLNRNSSLLRIAASVALLIAGGCIGFIIQQGLFADKQAVQMDNFQMEIGAMKELLMISLLDEDSPSQRIRAVSYSEDITNPESDITQILIHTLNTDENVNVRLAAAYSLARFSDDATVRDSLITSLGKQTDPIIQVILMNILVENKEFGAIKPMRELISNKNTMTEVKEIAEKSIRVLL